VGLSFCQATRRTDPVATLKLTPPVTGLLGLRHQAGLALLLEPVAVALDQDGVAVVKQAVEDGGGQDLIAEHGAPLGDELVGGVRAVLEADYSRSAIEPLASHRVGNHAV
jgi:hypothetical protein